MKKIIIGIMLIINIGNSTEIKEIFQEINKIEDQNDRIEKKLDLILLKFVQDEKNTAYEKTKTTIKEGSSWFKEQFSSFGDKKSEK